MAEHRSTFIQAPSLDGNETIAVEFFGGWYVARWAKLWDTIPRTLGTLWTEAWGWQPLDNQHYHPHTVYNLKFQTEQESDLFRLKTQQHARALFEELTGVKISKWTMCHSE
jgi:hypothetical protein